ncbi:MAG: kynureninase [Aliidongia sp.]
MSPLRRADLATLDRDDPLRPFRDRFALPEGVIYLDGNSLGAMPKSAPARLREVAEIEWGQDLIRSWNKHGWIDLQQRIGSKIGRLIGARPGETIVADSTSVNLFKLLAAALQLRPGRSVILSEPANFPTDLYIAEGLAALLGGHRLELVEPEGLEATLGPDVAVVMLTHVNYRTGRMHDMNAVTQRVHEAGALMLWDLCHSAGAVPVDLTRADADFAVGCGYKYLNGGPGAPAFLHIAERWQNQVTPPLTGWLGHAAPFAFETHYRPAGGVQRAVVGTPPVLSMTALEVGVDLMLEAPMAALRAKSVRQFELFAALVEQELAAWDFRIVTPRDAIQRGSQICLSHEQGWPIMQALIQRNVIGDFRAPDILRFGFTPLYVGYAEIWDAVAILKDIMATGAWDRPEHHARAKVT